MRKLWKFFVKEALPMILAGIWLSIVLLGSIWIFLLVLNGFCEAVVGL